MVAVVLVAAAGVAVPVPGEVASKWGRPVVLVEEEAAAVAATKEVVARWVLVGFAAAAVVHSLPAVEFLLVVAAEGLLLVVAVVAEAVALAAGAVAGAVALLRRESGFRHGPFVETNDPSEWVCGVPSIAREVAVFPSVPFFVAERCWSVRRPSWRCRICRGPPF